MDIRRIKQVLKFASIHSKQLAEISKKPGSRLRIYIDMLICFRKYKMWTNQYVKEQFHLKSGKEKAEIGNKYLEKGKIRDNWQNDFIENRKFLNKYADKKYELPLLREKRNLAYRQRYNMGKGCLVEYNVELSRQHYLNGSIKIGNNVLLAKNVFIDYSGEVIIENDVKIADGVIIESHHRDLEAYEKGLDVNIPTSLLIKEGAYIGTRAIILDSCNYIGKSARIGAGAVVTRDIPDFATAVGVPAKVVKINQG